MIAGAVALAVLVVLQRRHTGLFRAGGSPPQRADIPAPKLRDDGRVDARFIKMHENFLRIAKSGQGGLLFLGDSITEGWLHREQRWKHAFGKYDPINFGIQGDRTQHLLWRLQNGELNGIQPKVVVVLIGTNNSDSDSAEDIASGIAKIVETIRNKTPGARILLLGIFPRDAGPGPTRKKLAEVNSLIAKLDDGENVYFLDIGDKFLNSDKSLSREVMPDFLHLSPKGYEIWADAISPKLAELMK
jgi:lysophospholipase L1-like esterase